MTEFLKSWRKIQGLPRALSKTQVWGWENMTENATEKRNILEHESGDQVLLIYAKNQSSKISCKCPFKRLIKSNQ